MTENALKKILTMTVMKEFPEIEGIQIFGDNFHDSYIKKYEVFFGITPENMKKVNTDKVREKIKEYSKYILDSKKEKLGSILVYNPKDWK